MRKEMAWAIMYTQPGAFTGHVMLVIMLLMCVDAMTVSYGILTMGFVVRYTTAHARIRHQCFEAFWSVLEVSSHLKRH